MDTVPLFSLSFHFHSFSILLFESDCYFLLFFPCCRSCNFISTLRPPPLPPPLPPLPHTLSLHICLCFHRWPINFESMFKYPFWMAQHLNEYRLRTKDLKYVKELYTLYRNVEMRHKCEAKRQKKINGNNNTNNNPTTIQQNPKVKWKNNRRKRDQIIPFKWTWLWQNWIRSQRILIIDHFIYHSVFRWFIRKCLMCSCSVHRRRRQNQFKKYLFRFNSGVSGLFGAHHHEI